MEIRTFFFDTYALYEILHDNKNYLPYTKGISAITTKLTLMELHYVLLRNYGSKIAKRAYGYLLQFCIDVDDDTIQEANAFRLKRYRRELSYVDCIGYVLARKRNAKFLTGDKQFEDLDNVEFVK